MQMDALGQRVKSQMEKNPELNMAAEADEEDEQSKLPLYKSPEKRL